jgi:drug/metabolite transporter (DMT)-like permease
MMPWLILSLLTALSVATHDAWVKKYFGALGAFGMAAYPMAYSLPLFLAAGAFVPVPPLDAVFAWCFVVLLPLNAVSFMAHMQAIRISPLSLTLPYLAFTPVFIIGTGLLFLGEVPNAWGTAGILVTCLGGYVLNLKKTTRTLLDPLRAAVKEPGSRLMMLVAFLYAFGSVLGKKGILHSSPLFFGIWFFVVYNIMMLILFKAMGKLSPGTLRQYPAKGAAAGIMFFGHVFFHSLAISMVKAAYMMSIKRLSVLFGILYGGIWFKEKDIPIRFAGALLMLSGSFLIMFKGR